MGRCGGDILDTDFDLCLVFYVVMRVVIDAWCCGATAVILYAQMGYLSGFN